jgi:hypothetical protein
MSNANDNTPPADAGELRPRFPHIRIDLAGESGNALACRNTVAFTGKELA